MGKWTQAGAKKAAAISAAGAMLTDEQAYTVPAIFMPWNDATAYALGDRVRYNGLLYKCLQAHTALSVWTPDAAASLWLRIDDPAIPGRNGDSRQALRTLTPLALAYRTTQSGGSALSPPTYGNRAYTAGQCRNSRRITTVHIPVYPPRQYRALFCSGLYKECRCRQ